MTGQLVRELAAVLDRYDGDAGGKAEAERGKFLADGVREALLAHADRQKAEAVDPFLTLPKGFKVEQVGPLLTLPDRAEVAAAPEVLVAQLAAALLGGSGLTFMTETHLGIAVDKAAQLLELSRAKAARTTRPTPAPFPGPPAPDAATAYLEWLVARGGAAEYGERPDRLTDAQAAECRRVLLKRGVVAYGGNGTLELTADGRRVAAALLRPGAVLVNGGPHTAGAVKLEGQDDAA